MDKSNFIKELFINDNIKLIKNKGIKSNIPINIDLASITLKPSLLNKTIDLLIEKIRYIDFDYICGIDNGMIYASIIAFKLHIPLLTVKKKFKKYNIENVDESTKHVLLIQDIYSTGKSTKDFIKNIKCFDRKIVVKDVISIYNKSIEVVNVGYKLYSIFTIYDVINTLYYMDFLDNKFITNFYSTIKSPINISFYETIRNIIKHKGTNICYKSTHTDFFDLISELSKIGNYICMLRININTITQFTLSKARILKKLAIEKNFLIFEDSLFNCSNDTLQLIINNSLYHYTEWVDIFSINLNNIDINLENLNKLNYYFFIKTNSFHNMTNVSNIIGILNDYIINDTILSINNSSVLLNKAIGYSYNVISVCKEPTMSDTDLINELINYKNNYWLTLNSNI
jgi:uridine monophosphate synthetase